jgi:hypothetical protein
MWKVADMDHCGNLMLSVSESSVPTECGSETDSIVSRWADESDDEFDGRTTVMIRGLNTTMDRDALLEVLNASHFRSSFDFIYVPCDFNTHRPQGFAFVNFTSHRNAQKFQMQPLASLGAEARILWSDKEQGQEENVGRYRNSPVMHPSLPEHLRPSLVRTDAFVALPKPTRPIKAPKVKRSLP